MSFQSEIPPRVAGDMSVHFCHPPARLAEQDERPDISDVEYNYNQTQTQYSDAWNVQR